MKNLFEPGRAQEVTERLARLKEDRSATVGSDERGAGGGALRQGPGMGGAGQNSGSHVVLAADDWADREADGTGKR
jgi:hypothetical protein